MPNPYCAPQAECEAFALDANGGAGNAHQSGLRLTPLEEKSRGDRSLMAASKAVSGVTAALQRGRWVVAVVAAAAGVGLRSLLDAWLGDAVPFVFAFPAVIVVARIAGLGPAFLTAAMSAAWAAMPWAQPMLDGRAPWRTIVAFLPSAIASAYFATRFGRIEQAPAKSQEADRHGTLAWLKRGVVLAAVVPALMFETAAAYLHHDASSQAELRIDRAARIGEEHALKVF